MANSAAQRALCIGFGKREGRCLNNAGSTHSQLWCQECDDARRAHISAQFEKIKESFPPSRTRSTAGKEWRPPVAHDPTKKPAAAFASELASSPNLAQDSTMGQVAAKRSGRSSRRKGSVGELELARLFTHHGFAARRTPNSGGLTIRDDLTGENGQPVISGYLIEVKRCQTLLIPAWLRKAYAAAGVRQPLLFFRRDKKTGDVLGEWHVVTSATDYLALQAELRELRRTIAVLDPAA